MILESYLLLMQPLDNNVTAASQELEWRSTRDSDRDWNIDATLGNRDRNGTTRHHLHSGSLET